MKRRLSIALSAALLLGACAKEAPSGERRAEPGEGQIRAAAEEVYVGGGSRSSFDEDGRVAWSQGDVIGVMTADNTDANLTYRALTEADASNGLFTMEGDITLSGETFYAYYPMVPGNRLGADLTLPVTLPAVQTYRQGSFGPNANISVAVSTDGANYAFKNACGYLDIRLLGSTEDKISSVEVTAGGAVIAGSGSVDFDDYASGPLFVPDGGGSTSVRLECGDGIALNPASATSFHVVLPAGNYASVGVTARTSDGRSYSYTKSPAGGVVIERSTVTLFKPSEFFDGIQVENPSGELAARLAGTDASSVTALRITGAVEEADFAYIRGNLTALELLDLSGTEMTVFPDRALAFYDGANTTLKEVILPEGLTTIEDAAFANCTALEKLDVPSTVTTLGRWILENTQVASFTIPTGVTEIPASCFYKAGLTSITLPESVTTIGAWAFQDCPISELVIPSTVTFIGNGAFGCFSYFDDSSLAKLESVTIEGGITEIPESCFIYQKSLSSINLPEGVTAIGADAFNQCQISSLTLPSSLEVIGQRAFSNNGITSLTIPDKVKRIDFSAFAYNNLETIDLPASIEVLASTAFHWESTALKTVICRAAAVPEMPTSYTDDLGSHTYPAFIRINKANVILKVPAASVEEYETAWGSYFSSVEAIE